MADVHLFCDIRAGEVNDYDLWLLYFVNSQAPVGVGLYLQKFFSEITGFQTQIYKARTGDLNTSSRFSTLWPAIGFPAHHRSIRSAIAFVTRNADPVPSASS